jgi:hypothetical protein
VASEARFDRLYVTDTAGDALLVFDTRPALELVRRVICPARHTASSSTGVGTACG